MIDKIQCCDFQHQYLFISKISSSQNKILSQVFRKYEKMRDSTQLSPQHSPPTPPVTPSNTSSLPQIQPQPQLQPQLQPQVQPQLQPQAPPVAPVVEDNVVQGSCESVAAINIGIASWPLKRRVQLFSNFF